MPATDHGDDIGDIKIHFLLYSVNGGGKRKAAVSLNAVGWKLVILRKLPA
jgi:hypothetical protein